MLTELKELYYPVYPKPVIPSYVSRLKKYLKTRDFYDLPDEVGFDAYLYQDSFEIVRKRLFSRNARLIIYPADIVAIYGQSASTARRLLREIRDEKGLRKGNPVTIRDFCEHTELDYQTIHDFIMES